MLIGVPRETHRHEHRVGLTPLAVARLAEGGHAVFVQRDAGLAAHFTDSEYRRAGAEIIYSSEEVYKRADLVCRVGSLFIDELNLLKPGSTVCAFHHLALASRETIDRFAELEITAIGYELIEDERGERPVLVPLSEIAGQMAVYLAAHYLQSESAGRGILMGDAPGIAPPTVLILGAGNVGRTAALRALACGAHVVVVDKDMHKLRLLDRETRGQAVTVLAPLEPLERLTAIADVVIGAVLDPGAPAPVLVTEEMVTAMRPGSVIIDLAIDQGGCVETSRPTTLGDPTFVVHDVVHYCVPNMTANVARTASRALARAVIPLLLDLVGKGLERVVRDIPGFAAGVYVYKGKLVNEQVAAVLRVDSTPLPQVVDAVA